MTTERDLIRQLAETLAEEYGVQREFDDGDPLLGSGAIELLSRTRAFLDQPEPEGPTDEEINDLFWKHSSVIGDGRCGAGVGLADEDAPALIREALARWGRLAVEPVPVSERLPGEGDCDPSFQCWWFTPSEEKWILWPIKWAGPECSHWLPHHALPLPTTTIQEKFNG